MRTRHRAAGWPSGSGLAPGTVVAGAVRDEASMNLGQEAVDALRSLGLVDLRGHFRWGHAFIAPVGDRPGHARSLRRYSPGATSFGFPVSEPPLAAQVFEVQIVKSSNSKCRREISILSCGHGWAACHAGRA